MLTEQRKRHLLDLLVRDGRIVARTVSAALGLSEDTIRRDLRELASQGLLQRVHGGALPASPAIANLAARRAMSADAKVLLGAAAVKLLVPGQTVIVDGGTTHFELIRHLPLDFEATVITHSPAIAAALEFHQRVEVILIGGRLFRHSMVTMGAAAMEAISRLRADLFILGVTGVHPVEGLTTGDFEEAHTKRALMSRAAETIVLATPEKLGAASAHQVAPLSAISTLVAATEGPLDEFTAAGMTVIRV